jgi:hypothetical protein
MQKMKKWEIELNNRAHEKRIRSAKSTIPHPQGALAEVRCPSTVSVSCEDDSSYKILKQFSLQQYYKKLTDLGVIDVHILLSFTRKELDELYNTLKLLPGHSTKFDKMIDILKRYQNQELTTHPSQISTQQPSQTHSRNVSGHVKKYSNISEDFKQQQIRPKTQISEAMNTRYSEADSDSKSTKRAKAQKLKEELQTAQQKIAQLTSELERKKGSSSCGEGEASNGSPSYRSACTVDSESCNYAENMSSLSSVDEESSVYLTESKKNLEDLIGASDRSMRDSHKPSKKSRDLFNPSLNLPDTYPSEERREDFTLTLKSSSTSICEIFDDFDIKDSFKSRHSLLGDSVRSKGSITDTLEYSYSGFLSPPLESIIERSTDKSEISP